MAAVEVRQLTVEFPAVRALDSVSLSFLPGEVHAVVGENGAGKSTLMKVLAGLQRPTSGQVLVDGAEVSFRGVRDAERNGVAMVHQELNLIDDLNVAENVFLGREPARSGVIDRSKQSASAAELLAEVGAEFAPETPVSSLTVAQKQLVEIAKAVSIEAKTLILDEPTAVLTERETTKLFELIRALRERGIGVIYISHLLDEILDLSDKISVLRDGKLVAEPKPSEVDAKSLANLMVGRELGDIYPERLPPATAEPRLIVDRVSSSDLVNDVSFQVAPGEIVGLAGLIGAGRTEVAEAIAGLRPRVGFVRVDGEALRPNSSAAAKKAGIAYVSEDRKSAGLHIELSSVHNVTLANLAAYGWMPDRVRERSSADRWKKELDLRANDLDAPVGTLSGGNQQKVALAKWLDTEPKALILDEPTRGVDVGAKREIYNVIHALAAQGLACVVISSEMPELIGLCSRVWVMREGRVVGELVGDEITEPAMMELAAGVETHV